MTRKNSSLLDAANLLISLSNVIVSFGNIFITNTQEQRAREIHAHRVRNFSLKNEHEDVKIVNTCTVQGLNEKRIEFLELKIKREKWAQKNAGIGAPSFVASDYAEPGDVRRGVFVQ